MRRHGMSVKAPHLISFTVRPHHTAGLAPLQIRVRSGCAIREDEWANGRLLVRDRCAGASTVVGLPDVLRLLRKLWRSCADGADERSEGGAYNRATRCRWDDRERTRTRGAAADDASGSARCGRVGMPVLDSERVRLAPSRCALGRRDGNATDPRRRKPSGSHLAHACCPARCGARSDRRRADTLDFAAARCRGAIR